MSTLGGPDKPRVEQTFRRRVAGWRPALAPLLVLLFVLAEASSVAQAAETYAKAYRLANRTGRPMVVLVGAEWCGPCQNMKRKVIPQIKRRRLFGRIAFATVNVDREKALGKQLIRGGPIPQLLMFRRTRRGWRMSRLTGGQSVDMVAAFIDDGLKRDSAEKAAEGSPTAPVSNPAEDSAESSSG